MGLYRTVTNIRVEVGWAPALAQLFHSISKAQAQAQLKPDLFSKFPKPSKARAQKYEAQPRPEHAKIGPTHLYLRVV
jgi:hypothetical protein